MQRSTRRPSPALVVAIMALIVSLTGTAWAVSALPKNSVGSRQLKSKSVTTGKIATNAVNGSKIANGTLSGQDIDINKLGTVPSATEAEKAGRATSLVDSEGKLHTAGCPAGTALIRGICFDVNLNPVIHNVKEAADGCAAKGGYLPTVMELYSARGALNLGSISSPPNFAITDSYTSEPVGGGHYGEMGVDKNGTISIFPDPVDARYVCAYQLIR